MPSSLSAAHLRILEEEEEDEWEEQQLVLTVATALLTGAEYRYVLTMTIQPREPENFFVQPQLGSLPSSLYQKSRMVDHERNDERVSIVIHVRWWRHLVEMHRGGPTQFLRSAGHT